MDPGYTNFLQDKIENSAAAARELAKVRGGKAPLKAVQSATGGLPDYGVAPPLKPDGDWINTKPLVLSQLRGKVVLIDFWTYSCINCLRTLPHLKAWYATYHKDGFVIIGVHTPEFAFEHVSSNVRSAVKRLGITLSGRPGQSLQDVGRLREPVLAGRVSDRQDRPHPAYELRRGRVRQDREPDPTAARHEGREGTTGRRCDTDGSAHARNVPRLLASDELRGYVGLTGRRGQLPPAGKRPQNTFAYGGRWRVGGQEVVAGNGATLRLHFQAKNVYVVLGGHGTVRSFIDGKPGRTLHVNAQRLYTVRASAQTADATLELRFTPGIQGYSFTFG